jgi:hypothetical protein
MMLAHWCSLQGGAHSDKDVGGGSVWQDYGCFTVGLSTWAAVFPRDDRNLGDKD